MQNHPIDQAELATSHWLMGIRRIILLAEPKWETSHWLMGIRRILLLAEPEFSLFTLSLLGKDMAEAAAEYFSLMGIL